MRGLNMTLRRLAILALVTVPAAYPSAVFDLKTDWSDTTNPNGVWAYLQGVTPLPHQTDIGIACCGSNSHIAGGWAPGVHPFPGNFLPLWVKTVGDDSAGWLAGDIVMHSVDGGNGNPGLGEGNITWTAPADGIIDVSGGVWYAQLGVLRSNDFFLTLGGATLASGSIGAGDGRSRDHPVTFSLTGLSVNAGDVLRLQIQRSPGQFSGSFAGVNLTITETSASDVPEPASAAMFTFGLGALALFSSRMSGRWSRPRFRISNRRPR